MRPASRAGFQGGCAAEDVAVTEARGRHAPRLFAGWYVAAGAFAVLFLAYGLQFSYGLFVTGMANDLGWSRAETSLPYSVYVLGYMLLSVVTGRATDRFGPRVVITIGAALLGLGWGLSALVTERWHLHLTLGCIAALGMSVTWVPCNATVARWFVRRRGYAVGIASSGTSFGNFIVPAIAAPLIAAFGWRIALATLAVACALLMMVAARFMLRDPESHGLSPDGDPLPAVTAPVAGVSLREAMRAETFWLLTAIYVVTWLAVFMPFVHAVAMAEDLGYSKPAAASVLSAIGIGGVLGRLCSGALMDRLGHFPTLLAIFALQVASFVLFACATRLPLLWFAAALFGFAYGGGVTALAPLCSALYGRAHVASIVGAIFALTALPSAAGPWIAGWLYDATGGYAPALWFAAGLNVAALVLTLVLSRRAHYR